MSATGLGARVPARRRGRADRPDRLHAPPPARPRGRPVIEHRVDGSSPLRLTALRRLSPSRRRFVEQPLHDHAVSPLSLELPVTPIHADNPEPAPLVQNQARRVLREDARQDLPKPPLRIDLADASSAARPAPVPRAARATYTECSATPGVGRPTAIGARARPGHDLAIALHDHGGEAVPLVDELRGEAAPACGARSRTSRCGRRSPRCRSPRWPPHRPESPVVSGGRRSSSGRRGHGRGARDTAPMQG